MLRRTLGTFLLLILLAIPAVSLANSAPPRTYGDKPGVLVPGASHQVHINREDLQFVLTNNGYAANVTARYEMENRGGALTDFPVAFALQGNGGSQHDLNVTWNGKPLSVILRETGGLSDEQRREMDQAWTAMDFVVDPVSGESRKFQGAFGHNLLSLGLFNLSMDAGAKGTLEVTYEGRAAMDRTVYAYPVYHFQYLLLPARSWASFGPLEIRVQGADPKATFFKSNLPFTYQDGEWRASFNGLPDQNLAFSVMSRKGIIGNMATSGPYQFAQFILYSLIVTLIAIGLGKWCAVIRKKAWAVVVAVLSTGLLVGVGGFMLAFGIMSLIPPAQGTGYGGAFLAFGETFLSVPIMAAVAGIVAARKNDRLYGELRLNAVRAEANL